jgi:hypothetical protein
VQKGDEGAGSVGASPLCLAEEDALNHACPRTARYFVFIVNPPLRDTYTNANGVFFNILKRLVDLFLREFYGVLN